MFDSWGMDGRWMDGTWTWTWTWTSPPPSHRLPSPAKIHSEAANQFVQQQQQQQQQQQPNQQIASTTCRKSNDVPPTAETKQKEMKRKEKKKPRSFVDSKSLELWSCRAVELWSCWHVRIATVCLFWSPVAVGQDHIAIPIAIHGQLISYASESRRSPISGRSLADRWLDCFGPPSTAPPVERFIVMSVPAWSHHGVAVGVEVRVAAPSPAPAPPKHASHPRRSCKSSKVPMRCCSAPSGHKLQ
uniref:HDC17724 n=1 Tax=Drosophila melanogaster TaxID=7227 RepID=Q6IIL0_DROME|nr:TPA_inf: HDC17724 [Drosophila melanogaster]